MSYCVNCGVELAPSEKCCPLCNTEVVNPKEKWTEPDIKPYPNRVEQIVQKVNRKFMVALLAELLMIPVVIPVLTDFLFNHRLSWSLYVVGAVACVFFLVVFPLLYENPKPYLYLGIDTVVVVGYVALIAYSTSGMDWFWRLGFPIALSACIAVSVSIYIVRRSRLTALVKATILSILTALACVSIDFFINRFVGNDFILLWSLFVVGSCLVISSMLLVLNRRKKLQEEIIKRLFV